MIEELRQVDVSILDSLIDLRRERDTLRQRLARMGESASQVSEAVLARVRGDYEARIAALDAKAAPLKDEARVAYEGLRPLLEGAREAFNTLRLDQEELELRHRLGEFDDEAYRNKVANLGEALRGAEGRSAEISELVARFVGAFDSPDDLAPALTSQLDLPAAPEHAAPHLAGPGAVPRDEEGTLVVPPEPPPAPEPPPLPPPQPASAGWLQGPQESAGGSEPIEPTGTSEPGFATAAQSVYHEPEASTSTLPAPPAAAPRARLEALDGDLDPEPHFLEPLTFIGRTPENQVRIYKPAVSRRHAQITATEAGWFLRDLSSENGTYVNGQRVSERLLVEGDRVQFGTSRFVLRITQ